MTIKTITPGYQCKRNLMMVASILLALLLIVSPDSYAVKTYVVGNHANKSKTNDTGPTGAGLITMQYLSKPMVIFSRTSTLTPANVTLNWDSSHGSRISNDSVYCTRSSTGTGNGLSIESGFISAGSYGGIDIFKTNITGLYFSIALRSFSSDIDYKGTSTNIQIKNGILHNALNFTDQTGYCDLTNTTGNVNYATPAGIGFYTKIIFYTDQTYTPGSSSISLLKSGAYHLRIWNENPGAGIASNYDNITYDISSVMISEPTCSTQPVASGSSVSGTTVNLGNYSPNDIINGATAVPFAIKLAGCKGLRNINVTLSSTTVATDATLLGNILTLNHATGVGLEIRGTANNYSAETLMIPNESTSVYNDQRNTSSDNNIYGTSEAGKTQTHELKFLATLKRDSNQKIGSGNFKANGIFTLDYP